MTAAPARVLVVDDVPKLRETLKRALSREGFRVVTAGDGQEALHLASESPPDLVLTDAQMPKMDGHELCRRLKRAKGTASVPVVIMSGEMVEEDDVVRGLDGGADDYVLKPLQMGVLLARLNAVLRRYRKPLEADGTLKSAGIEMDPGARTVRVEEETVSLARKEFDLLALFIEKAGRVLTSNYLLETVWGYDVAEYNDPHTVETHISNLRRKLGRKAGKRVVNVRGIGYRFD